MSDREEVTEGPSKPTDHEVMSLLTRAVAAEQAKKLLEKTNRILAEKNEELQIDLANHSGRLAALELELKKYKDKKEKE